MAKSNNSQNGGLESIHIDVSKARAEVPATPRVRPPEKDTN